jgi:hypothetical protein
VRDRVEAGHTAGPRWTGPPACPAGFALREAEPRRFPATAQGFPRVIATRRRAQVGRPDRPGLSTRASPLVVHRIPVAPGGLRIAGVSGSGRRRPRAGLPSAWLAFRANAVRISIPTGTTPAAMVGYDREALHRRWIGTHRTSTRSAWVRRWRWCRWCREPPCRHHACADRHGGDAGLDAPDDALACAAWRSPQPCPTAHWSGRPKSEPVSSRWPTRSGIPRPGR